ncbi:FAD-dependent monooxygenase [Spirosoma sp. SC4-14]|uniref:FAD-dependent monooxygenase n=1 Tax=Spirosoma sp. SC4-14 TaxID=3128900 RepID=UPI0030CD62E4
MKTFLQTDVLIIGAGPTGLSLAAQLIRFGIDFILVDGKESVTELSKAMVVHARTLEIFDQLGLAQKAVYDGAPVQKGTFLHKGEVSAQLDFSDIGGQLSPFPFILVFEQCKTEHLLYDYLQQNEKEVRWQTELQQLTQEPDRVLAELESKNGEPITISARYVVGCDGAGSLTRHLAGLGFEGSTDPRLFYVADVDMDFGLSHHADEQASFFATFGEHAFVLLFPMAGHRHWRLIGNLPEYDEKPDTDIPYNEIETKVKTLVKRPLEISNVRWFSTYKVHTRRAERFSAGRCFLAGDAAHIHTPAGGQGMNTGIQDAYNLAWKLAFVVTGQAAPALLETYNEERLANAQHLLKTTDQFFEIATADNWYTRFFRDSIFPELAGLATRFDVTREFIFPTISMIAINYRENSLSDNQTANRLAIKAGDRMPYFRIEGTSLYEKLKAPLFHLLIFSDGQNPFKELQEAILSRYATLIDINIIPLYPSVVAIFDTQKPFLVLLRPDNYIGLITTELSSERIFNYLIETMKIQSNR